MKAFFILSLALFSVAQGERVVCDLEDSKCLTETAGSRQQQFIDGIPGYVETSEPLYENEIEVTLPSLYYKFNDAKLSGLRQCKVDLVKFYTEDSKYDYHVGCSHLTLDAKYVIEGVIGPHYVEGNGDCTLDFYDYVFLFHGDYVSSEGEDGKTHITLKTHTLEVQNNGHSVYDFRNLFNGDKERSDVVLKWFNDNSQLVEKESGKPSWDVFMGNKYFNNVLAYLDNVSADELFSKEV